MHHLQQDLDDSVLYVGTRCVITEQRKESEGKKKVSHWRNQMHNCNCTINFSMSNPIQCSGRGLFIPSILLQHSKNAPPGFPEINWLQQGYLVISLVEQFNLFTSTRITCFAIPCDLWSRPSNCLPELLTGGLDPEPSVRGPKVSFAIFGSAGKNDFLNLRELQIPKVLHFFLSCLAKVDGTV